MPNHALEPLRIPDEFWDRGEVITALDRRSIGQVFRLIRRYAGASQTRIGTAVGLAQGTVSLYMSGQRTVTTIDLLERVAAGLRLPDHARLRLGLAPCDASTSGRPPEPEGPSAGDYERLCHALRHPTRVDLVAAAHLREQVQRLDEQYDRTPSALLLAATGQVHGQITYLRGQAANSAARRQLWAAEAESAILMGLLVWDASQRRDHASAVAYFDQAITAARQARDIASEAHAELRKSYICLYGRNDPATGLDLAQRAADLGRQDSQVIAGLAMLHVGEANAMLGRRISCDRALNAATETHFAQITPDDPAAVLYSPSLPGRLAGSCWLSLGRPDKAEHVLDQTRSLCNDQNKATAILLGNLALASIRRGDIDAGTSRLHETITILEPTRGAGGLNIVCTAARELRPWRSHPVVQDLTDRIFTLMTAA
ncbi:MAG: helix-turn-helix domain-containing protein [Dactylosporangium sp.]|nr:helix-turn-helix domain-containing protein [Dactylosporangium sp.]NNJ62260.1 helix-turn-helix domain-containing protein [Dactylosporangium sp.]